jgi:hypothetical protein
VTSNQRGTIAAVVCATAFVSAASLAYAVHRPLVAPTQNFATEEVVLSSAPVDTRIARPPQQTEETRVVQLAPIEIVGRAVELRPKAIAAPRDLAAPRQLQEMRCTNWRALQDGPETQRVRICE